MADICFVYMSEISSLRVNMKVDTHMYTITKVRDETEETSQSTNIITIFIFRKTELFSSAI